MATRTLTDHDQLTIVKLLAAGRDADFVGAAVNIPRDLVIDIASRHGHPDKEKLAWAADIMQANIDKQRTNGIPAATPIRSAARGNGTTLAAVPSPPRPTETQPKAPAVIHTGTAGGSSPNPSDTPHHGPQPLELVDLLDLASKSPKAATRTKGERLTKLISELRQTIRDETEDRVRAEKEKKRQDAAMSEIVALEAQLAAARAKLGIGKKKPAAHKTGGHKDSPAQVAARAQRAGRQDFILAQHRVTRAEVFSWARAHGWPDISGKGAFIKTEVLDAFDAYQQGR